MLYPAVARAKAPAPMISTIGVVTLTRPISPPAISSSLPPAQRSAASMAIGGALRRSASEAPASCGWGLIPILSGMTSPRPSSANTEPAMRISPVK